jgi:hypothetical protein
MYQISGIFGLKVRFDGSVARQKVAFSNVTLHTERGVMNFIDEEKPFDEIKIIDVATNKDVTEYFLGPVGAKL